ncbi:MAG: hypothetical protein QXW98_04635 [Candidatus Caldarchaeum sp.]
MKDREIQVGKHKLEKRGGKYILDGKELTFDDLMEIRSAVQRLIEEEHNEILEEKRARGEKIYREVRGGEVVEY